mgnify:CR=1 FL=1
MTTKTIDLSHLVAHDMVRVEDKMREVAGEENKSLMAVIDYLVDNGGKQLRPKIALAAAKFGNPDPDKAVSLAAAGDSVAGPVYMGAAVSVLAALLTPFAMAAALRISLD